MDKNETRNILKKQVQNNNKVIVEYVKKELSLEITNIKNVMVYITENKYKQKINLSIDLLHHKKVFTKTQLNGSYFKKLFSDILFKYLDSYEYDKIELGFYINNTTFEVILSYEI